jgi:tetratricopeptide (TPR) repeat protein
MAYSKIKHVEAAQKHLGQNRVPQAIAEYQQILKHEPGDQVTLMTVGDLYVRQGETFQAIDYFARLAQIFIRDGFLTKAIAIYKKIAKLAPEEMKPLERLAELYVQQGVLSEARPIFLQLAEGHLKANRREPAAALLRKLLEAEPDNLRVQMRLADVQLAMGQNQDAAQTLLVCAERQLVNRDPEEAVKLCERAVALAPENLLARLLMARALSAAGRRKEAVVLLESAPDLESGNEASAQLLEIYLQEENAERAGELARRVLGRDPKHYAMAAKTVMAMVELGQADNALLLLDEIRHTMPAADDAESLAQMLHAIAARFTGRIEPHEWLVDLYTQINDTFHLPDALAQLGQAAAAGGHFDRAREVYEQLIERSPEDLNIRANLEQVRARLGMKPLEAAAATPVPVVEEIVAPKKFEEPPLDEETEHFVTVALTDVDLFSSYGLTPKAIDLLERVILRAPRYTPALEKLLDLHLGEGNNQRTAELAEHLMKILTERGDTANAERFAELSRRFQRAASLDPAPAAAPAEFTIPKSDPGIDVSMKAPGDGEPVEEFVIEPTDARAPSKTKAPSPQDSVHELDLSDEWASISGQAGGGSTSEMIPDVEEPEDEREFNDVPAGVESNRSAFVIQEETENTNGSHKTESDDEPGKTHVVSDVESGNEIEVEQEAELQNEVELQKEAPAPEPVPVFANSGSAEHAEEEPAEYELELVEQASQPGSSSNVSPIRVVAEPDASPLGDLAMELGMVLDAAPPVAPSASGNGTARLNQFAKPAAPPSVPRREAPKPTVSMVGASDPGGPLSEVFAEFRAELEELQTDEDPETHYNLGIAYREMGLLEEAISEFQKVVQAHDHGVAFRYTMQCCTLLALAFMEKGQPEIAAFWYERALQTPDLDQESVLALQYDLGIAQDLGGHPDEALKSFQQVYALNIDYRDVAERIGSLRER